MSVHSQLDGADQALGNQQGEVFLEIACQRGRVAREREQALLLVDLDRILQRQTIQEEVKVLVPNLGELEFLRGRYHQVVILAVDSRLDLVRRRQQAQINVIRASHIGAAREPQIGVGERHALSHRVAVTQDLSLEPRLDPRPQVGEVRFLVETLEQRDQAGERLRIRRQVLLRHRGLEVRRGTQEQRQ